MGQIAPTMIKAHKIKRIVQKRPPALNSDLCCRLRIPAGMYGLYSMKCPGEVPALPFDEVCKDEVGTSVFDSDDDMPAEGSSSVAVATSISDISRPLNTRSIQGVSSQTGAAGGIHKVVAVKDRHRTRKNVQVLPQGP